MSVPKVTIETVDRAIRDWFDKTMDAHVPFPTGERKKVPVIFSVGERFATARQKKGIRDKNGVLILPVIGIRRTGIEASPVMSAPAVETPFLQVSKRVDHKTHAVQNAVKERVRNHPGQVLPGDKVVYEVTTIPFPDFSTVTYEIIIQSQYMQQMNEILEKFVHELDIQKSFVMPIDNLGRHTPSGVAFEDRPPVKGGYFVGFLDPSISSGDNFEEFTDNERIIQHSLSVRVPAYLQLDPEGERPSIRTQRTSFAVGFQTETLTHLDPHEIELIFESRDPISTYQEILRKKG